jgi:hypothetical protein
MFSLEETDQINDVYILNDDMSVIILYLSTEQRFYDLFLNFHVAFSTIKTVVCISCKLRRQFSTPCLQRMHEGLEGKFGSPLLHIQSRFSCS